MADSEDVSEFLEAFPTYHLHMNAGIFGNLYVFDSQDGGGGSQNNSSSADRQTTGTIQDKIKSALLSQEPFSTKYLLLLQFWAPVEIGGRQLLSTSGQPFAVNYPHNDLIKYRQRSTEYEYDIVDVNYRQEDEQSNPSGPPATAFLNRLPHIVDISEEKIVINNSIMLPICCPSQSSSTCVGVIEFSSTSPLVSFHLQWMNERLKEAGLSIFDVQERIPYKTLHGLKPVRDQIRDAIEILCKSHKLIFAQVWIAHHEDKNQVPFLSSFECAQKKHMLALKLTGYYNLHLPYDSYDYSLRNYCYLCDMVLLDTGKSHVEQTLQDYKSRFYKTCDRLNKNQRSSIHGYATKFICLRSIATGDFCYVFEFFYIDNSDYDFSLEHLLLALKGHLPSFKFASGAELGDELQVYVENSTESDIRSLKIFEGKEKSSMPKGPEEGKKQVVVKDITHLEMNCKPAPIDRPGEDIELQFEKPHKEAAKNPEERDSNRFKIQALEEGKKPAVVEDKESLKRKYKTTPIELTIAEIEKRFGMTRSDAAEDLKVSLSTLKRYCRKYRIYEWPGPLNPGKKKVNHSRNQRGTIEVDTGASLVPSALERNENNLTIKAEDSNDMIRFELPMSEVTFKSVEKEIVKVFELIPGTYKIKYCDEDEEWALLTPDCDMNYCIRSSKDSHKNIFRLHVERVSPSA